MSAETDLKTITPTEAKARGFWPLTLPYRLYQEYYEIIAEMERLERTGANVVLVESKPVGTAEIWKSGTEYTSLNPYDQSLAGLCRDRMGWL